MSNLILVVGATGSGKSRFTAERLLCNVVKKGPNDKDYYDLKTESKRQYVFDINNEYNLPIDTSVIYPRCRHTECNATKFIENCKRLANTNIVWEDATGYLRGKQQKEFIQLVQKRRHVNNNWILLFHSLYRIPPELMEFANYVVLFKTGDNLKAIEAKFNNPKLNEAFGKIQQEKKYSYAQIKMQ